MVEDRGRLTLIPVRSTMLSHQGKKIHQFVKARLSRDPVVHVEDGATDAFLEPEPGITILHLNP